MRAAKYYIYRNLHKGGFSVKYRGKVVGVYDAILAENVEFRVSQAGRNRVLKDKRKNVHAYVVSDSYKVLKNPQKKLDNLAVISYNPYKADYFFNVKDNSKVSNANEVLLLKNKCFLL